MRSSACRLLFYRRFRLCITALQKAPAQGKAHTPKVARILRLSLWESSRRSRVRGDIIATICPLRRLRRHLSQWERLFVSPIIAQIGRENNISAGSCRGYHWSPVFCGWLRAINDRPYGKHPYEKEPKGVLFCFL